MASLTFHGHSAAELVLGGKHVWIDPFLTGNPVAVVSAASARADIIAVTHGHNDHVGDTMELANRCDAVVVTTYELSQYLLGKGVRRVEPSNIGGTITIGEITIAVTAAWHSSAIETDAGALYMGPSTGMVVRGEGKSVYHMGDTGLFSDIKLIAERLGPFDAALIPTGDRFTMGLEDALLAARWINARVSIPIHNGTFPIIQNNGEAFARRVVESGGGAKWLRPGESITL